MQESERALNEYWGDGDITFSLCIQSFPTENVDNFIDEKLTSSNTTEISQMLSVSMP